MLAARAADLRDVGLRALRHMEPSLAGDSEQAATHGDPVVLIAADLAPSDTAALDIRRVAGLATTLGGPTSHTAILARTLGLPAIVAAGAELLDLVDGAQVIIDGDAGRIHLSPTEADLDSARAWIAQAEAARQAAAAERQLPANTRDGHTVAIGANIIRAEQVASALEQGAEGVGLMRTEFLFLERHDTPGEDEQFHAYRGMLDALAGRPLIVRTLDIGGDKQVPHLGLPWRKTPSWACAARAAAPPRSAGTPTARTLPRRRAGATCPSCFPWSHRWPNCFSRMPASACAELRPGSRWAS